MSIRLDKVDSTINYSKIYLMNALAANFSLFLAATFSVDPMAARSSKLRGHCLVVLDPLLGQGRLLGTSLC